ncbi:hypothetical protein STVA_23050 [Allostella vacuolata]|nr:hypothetical protein STVA_23050 [Stella vacuolata]
MPPRSVLICDDEPELAEEIAEFFIALGWSARIVNSGPEALRLLESGFSPTFLMTDLRMPGMTGEELIARVRRLPAHLRPRYVVVVTGHIWETMTPAEFDADRLFTKPIDPDALVAELDRMTGALPAGPYRGEAS